MKRLSLSRNGILIAAMFIFALAAGPALAGNWTALGSGVDNRVRALAFSESGMLYAGGDFTTAGGSSALRVAKWNGAAWSAMGSGINGAVYALATSGANTVYAGGEFSTADGYAAYKVAKWDGGAWTAVGISEHPGIQYGTGVYALAVDSSGNLYAGGNFATAEGVTVNNIAKWDGVSWSALGVGVNGNVWALAFDNLGNLYAGGNFSEAGGVTANYIAKWNGGSWSAVGSGIGGYVDDLAKDNAGNIYAVGRFNNAGGQTAFNVARWDGANWHPVNFGLSANPGYGAYAVAADGTLNIYVGGEFYYAQTVAVSNAAHWNGSEWQAMGTGTDTAVLAMCRVGSGAVVAGGAFGSAGGVPVNNIARWDGAPGGGTGLPLLNLLLSN